MLGSLTLTPVSGALKAGRTDGAITQAHDAAGQLTTAATGTDAHRAQARSPWPPVRAGSFLEREIRYLSGRGRVPKSAGTLMIPGGG